MSPDDDLRLRTGKGPKAWHLILDAFRRKGRDRAEAVVHLHRRFGLEPLVARELVFEHEVARGLTPPPAPSGRGLRMKRTIDAPVATAYAAWVDGAPARRLRASLDPAVLALAGTRAEAVFRPLDPDRVEVEVTHAGLRPGDERDLAERWAWLLDSLASYLADGTRISFPRWRQTC